MFKDFIIGLAISVGIILIPVIEIIFMSVM